MCVKLSKTYGHELFVAFDIFRRQICLTALLRTGFLTLAVEVGRFETISEENRMCQLYDLRQILFYMK